MLNWLLHPRQEYIDELQGRINRQNIEIDSLKADLLTERAKHEQWMVRMVKAPIQSAPQQEPRPKWMDEVDWERVGDA